MQSWCLNSNNKNYFIFSNQKLVITGVQGDAQVQIYTECHLSIQINISLIFMYTILHMLSLSFSQAHTHTYIIFKLHIRQVITNLYINITKLLLIQPFWILTNSYVAIIKKIIKMVFLSSNTY